MHRQRKSRFIPAHDQLESRSLLSTAVVDIENTSAYDISFAFRWSPGSAWTVYTEAPGQSEVLSTTDSKSVKPQVLYDATAPNGSPTEQTLAVNVIRGNGPAVATGKYYIAAWPSTLTDADTDPHTDPDPDADTDPHTDTDTDTDADAHTNSNANAELDRDHERELVGLCRGDEHRRSSGRLGHGC
jgi:hypothetical protein